MKILRLIFVTVALWLTVSGLSAREILLFQGPVAADWGDKNRVDPMQLAGVAAGDEIHVYVSNVQDGAKFFIRTMTNGWPAIGPAYDVAPVNGDISCVIDEAILKTINDQTLMFGGSGYTIERITLITDRPEDTRQGYDDLSNEKADAATRAVYDLLRDCYGKKSISCSMAEVNWNYKEAEYVKNWTGKYPAMNGFDYIHLSYEWETYRDITPVKKWWDMGGLVTICWHWRAPDTEAQWNQYEAGRGKTPFEGFYAAGGGSPVTTFSPANAVKEGTWENEFIRHDMAKVADRLELLKDAGIVVIWRPFHEAAGNSTIYSYGKAWFWWGADGAEPCVKLWRMMYDYFSQRGLNNLIWVWTSQTKDGDWYPGDEYVDMVGRDLYNYKLEDAAYNFKYLITYYPHKMVALTECGYGGGSSPYMTDQWEKGAKWSFGMPWYHYQYTLGGNHQYANKDWWQEWFKNENTITMDEMKTLREQYLGKSGVNTLNDNIIDDDAWYTIQGIRVENHDAPGLYIHKGKKILVR